MEFKRQVQSGLPDCSWNRARFLTDTGASGSAFIDEKYVRRNKILTIEMMRPKNLKLGDGEFVGQITWMAKVSFALDQHLFKF